MNVTNSTTLDEFNHVNHAIDGLLVFVFICMISLGSLLIILFQPCKTGKCKTQCAFCGLFFQFILLRIYKICCCKCCIKGHKYIIKRAGTLQEQMEKELEEDWDKSRYTTSSEEDEEEEKD